ncbi:DUF3343 domain-containing protein [Proteiniborus sp.]|uniref:DUF3343 domain-containing protein n=1 Tax=Proteiniborus sp. TaxID=2079015 RepID=UPI003323B86C
MKEEVYYVIAFDSTHYAIQGEKVLRDKDIDIKVIPTPREITASCGLSIRFNPELFEQIKNILKEYSLSIRGIYKLVKNNAGRSASKIN